VAEHLSFRAAAERLELTAPAVSHSIQQLEARLGARLLNRTTRSVSLTQTGLRLLDRLRPAFDEISRVSRFSLSLVMCTGGARRPFLHDRHFSEPHVPISAYRAACECRERQAHPRLAAVAFDL
jgi:DNA-binding transcriptional LysR family regulator